MPGEPIEEFYSAGRREWDRLGRGRGLLEFRRTTELLARLLPEPAATVLDVGGGPGRYAVWLADAGYDVVLSDLVPALAGQAAALARASRHTFGVVVADARHMGHPDGVADAVVLMGPLYHLHERGDRLRVLGEAHRVLRPGGVLVVSVIGRYTALLDASRVGGLDESLVARARHSFLADGRFESGEAGFTQAYFHTPREIADELTAAGFVDVDTFAVEGPMWTVLADAHEPGAPEGSDALLESAIRCARETETVPSLLGASSHLLAAGTRSPTRR